MPRKKLCLDFDGVLHAYSKGWHDGTIYDDPVPGAVEAVLALHERYDIVISTCRQDLDAIREWMIEHFGLRFLVTNEKPIAHLYLDDRGLHFDGDWDAASTAIVARLEGE